VYPLVINPICLNLQKRWSKSALVSPSISGSIPNLVLNSRPRNLSYKYEEYTSTQVLVERTETMIEAGGEIWGYFPPKRAVIAVGGNHPSRICWLDIGRASEDFGGTGRRRAVY